MEPSYNLRIHNRHKPCAPNNVTLKIAKRQSKNFAHQDQLRLATNLTRLNMEARKHEDVLKSLLKLDHLGNSRDSNKIGSSGAWIPNDFSQSTHFLGTQSKNFVQSWQDKTEKPSSEDRPIFIGISVPINCIRQETSSPKIALSSSVESSISNLTSSTYLRSHRCQHKDDTTCSGNIRYPPIFQVSRRDEVQRTIPQNLPLPDWSDSTTWIDDSSFNTPRSSTISHWSIFEEDESPIFPKIGNCRTSDNVPNNLLKVDTIAAQRCSRGWWNYILSPFLSASSSHTMSELEHCKRFISDSAGTEIEERNSAKQEGESLKKLYLDTEVKSVTSNTPQIQSARQGIRTTPLKASICLPCESKIIDVANYIDSNYNGNLSKRKSSSVGKTSLSYQSGISSASTPADNLDNFFNKISEPESVIVVRQSRKKYVSRKVCKERLTNRLSPALYVPPTYPHSRRKEKSMSNRHLFYPLTTREQSTFYSKPHSIQESNASSRPDASAFDILLSQVVREGQASSSKYLRIPVISNRGSILEKYYEKTQKVKSNTKRSSKRNFDRQAVKFFKSQDRLPKYKACFQNRAKDPEWRKCYLALIFFFLFIVFTILVVIILNMKPKVIDTDSRWLNLTGFPPMLLGYSIILSPFLTKEISACVAPVTQWSCHLPKELQLPVNGYPSNQPNFFLKIDWNNLSEVNTIPLNSDRDSIDTREVYRHNESTRRTIVFPRRSLRDRKLASHQVTKSPPDVVPPSSTEEWFLGETTDGVVSANKAGEFTPFSISFLKSASSTLRESSKIFTENRFPNITSIIPPPSISSDGTVAPANLLPSVNHQPMKLYDRDLPTEHFGFYSYFDRSIFLKSIELDRLSSENGSIIDDLNGGAARTKASYRCTWSQTRFLVQIWTRKNATVQVKHIHGQEKRSVTNVATQEPRSFPYPVSITLDRHGGNPRTKTIYCYKLDNQGKFDVDSGFINLENKEFGGVLINPAPTVFTNHSEPKIGGFDGGNSGCMCQWCNFEDRLI